MTCNVKQPHLLPQVVDQDVGSQRPASSKHRRVGVQLVHMIHNLRREFDKKRESEQMQHVS
jgi:hypothetical protein